MSSLDLDADRPASAPRAAATVILLRDGADGLEVAVMQRSAESRFLGGAIVFPGGRVDDDDLAFASSTARGDGAWWDDEGVAARVAGCRELLEEVGVALVDGATPNPASIASLRAASAKTPRELANALAAIERRFDLSRLVPWARWVTPEAEKRRYDTRFFVARAPHDAALVVDDHEATRAFFVSPRALLADFDRGEAPLFPPTHRTLEQLAPLADVEAALTYARAQPLLAVCPRFVVDRGVPTLALPGDPLHSISEKRIDGKTRYVLDDARWRSIDP